MSRQLTLKPKLRLFCANHYHWNFLRLQEHDLYLKGKRDEDFKKSKLSTQSRFSSWLPSRYQRRFFCIPL